MLRAWAIAVCLAGPIVAQEVAPQSGRLLVIDRGEVLAQSERGRAMLAELDAVGRDLAAENREIEARLREEERVLTERRPEMEPAAFRVEAEAFDARVQEIRDTQDAKRSDLLSRREGIEDAFWEDALPILAQILQEQGAVVVLDRDTVFLSSDAADITAEAIARIDAAGIPEPAEEPAQEPAEEPAEADDPG